MATEEKILAPTFAASDALCGVWQDALSAFADRVYLRDPRGLSRRPALISVRRNGRPFLVIQRDFQIRYEYVVTPQQGELFQHITNDPNALHRTRQVISGAMTAAKMLMPIEVLLPFLRLRQARFRFRAPAFYGERTTTSLWWRWEAPNAVRLDVTAMQRQQVVATGLLVGEIGPPPGLEEVERKQVDEKQLEIVSTFMQALGVDSRCYFEKDGRYDYTYPLAYLAALPSGEMVKQFEGDGGMISSLLLDLDGKEKIPLVTPRVPKVLLKLDRIRKAFSRILTDIIDGVASRCRGWAVVNPVSEFPHLSE